MKNQTKVLSWERIVEGEGAGKVEKKTHDLRSIYIRVHDWKFP